MEITITVPDDLAARLRPVEKELPQILELGMQAWTAEDASIFTGLADVLERLSESPALQDILSLRPTPALQNRISELVEKGREGRLSSEEQRAWEQYERLEHLVRMAKLRAALKLKEG